MPKAYSGDLRERVIASVASGSSRREAAEVFGVAVSTAVKWLQRVRDTGSAAAKLRGGSTSPLEKHAAEILGLVGEQPDATFKELLVTLGKRRIHTSRSALWRFFDRHKITFKKKSLRASEQHRKDVARARRKWIRQQGLLDPARLVFIDETAVNTSMARLYGRGMPFSKFKAYLRKLAQRTVPGLHCAIRSFLLSLDRQECANYFRHAGYASI